jgi:hypothetical protein
LLPGLESGSVDMKSSPSTAQRQNRSWTPHVESIASARPNKLSASLRYAILFFGRVGTLIRAIKLPASFPGDPMLIELSAASFRRNVIDPWRAVGDVDVFVHSWNPELARLMEKSYEPVASNHSSQLGVRMVCPSANYETTSCTRCMWHFLSIRHVVQMRQAWVAGDPKRQHDMIMLTRHDVFWLSALPKVYPGVRLWLPIHSGCVNYSAPDPHMRGGSMRLALERYSTPRRMPPDSRARKPFTEDWWAIMDAPLADGFAELSDHFKLYLDAVCPASHCRACCRAAPFTFWNEYLFGKHELHKSCMVGYASMGHFDYVLTRLILQPGAAEPLGSAYRLVRDNNATCNLDKQLLSRPHAAECSSAGLDDGPYAYGACPARLPGDNDSHVADFVCSTPSRSLPQSGTGVEDNRS